ncbi:MAG: hypothetical protein WBA84_00715 [Carnobacterium sp.]|uniref:hypothetical protein n=1 Tax=Carnobacterium sp. TaxID=48221 RepID=UPI003C712AE4
MGEYRKAADLYDWLCTVPFAAFDTENNARVEEELDLERLVEEGIVQIELRQMVLIYFMPIITPYL